MREKGLDKLMRELYGFIKWEPKGRSVVDKFLKQMMKDYDD